MKHLKTTIKLSVLALACMGAGALAFQPTAYAKAEDGAGCVTMQSGAAVCVSDDFSGIRWTTKVDFDKYQMLCGAGKTITFGTLVLPTDSLGEDGVLTEADQGAVNIIANIDVANLANDTEYYSIINYENLANAFTDEATKEDALKKAYALELTARSYVKVNDNYYFTEEMGTSRSAKQVALMAELAGDWDEEDVAKATKAATYYGMTERYVPTEISNGAAGTAVIDLEAAAKAELEVALDADFEGNVQSVFVGAERVQFVSYEDKKFTFKVAEGQYIPTGETYLTIYTDSGFVTEPIIGATKVLSKAEDLAMFNAKGGNGVYTTKAAASGVDYISQYWKPEQEQTGYYVLKNDIDASEYVHGSRYAADAADVVAGTKKEGDFNDNTWNGADNYENAPMGLKGTFNGLGYAIKDMEIGSQREGFFGIVNGGTVKNVAFLDVKAAAGYRYVIANYLIDATIENVYIRTDATVAAADGVEASLGFPAKNSALLASYAYSTRDGKNVISNVVLEMNAVNSNLSSNATHGLLFSTYKDANTEYNNLCAVSSIGFKASTSSSATANIGQRFVAYVKDSTKIMQFAENEVDIAEDGTATPNTANPKKVVEYGGWTVQVLMGTYRYKTVDDLKADADKIAWMPEGWLA